MTKLDYTLIPLEFDDLVLVAMNGAKKYEPHGWEKGIDKDQNLASVRRHENDYKAGKLKDDESGLHPLLHAAFRLMMQYTLDKRAQVEEVTYDYKGGAEGWNKLIKKLNDIPTDFKWSIHSTNYRNKLRVDEFKKVNGCIVYKPIKNRSETINHEIGCVCKTCEDKFWGKI
jgi:hypothetical protein